MASAFRNKEPITDSFEEIFSSFIRQAILGVGRVKTQISVICFGAGISATELESDMSLIIKIGGLIHIPIVGPLGKYKCRTRGIGFIPQQVRDCPLQADISISDGPDQYVLSSELPGVELDNLWVYIEGRSLTIYAAVTGEKQENGEYRYTEELLGGIKGEITLPEQVFQKTKEAEFLNGMLKLVFPKKNSRFSRYWMI